MRGKRGIALDMMGYLLIAVAALILGLAILNIMGIKVSGALDFVKNIFIVRR